MVKIINMDKLIYLETHKDILKVQKAITHATTSEQVPPLNQILNLTELLSVGHLKKEKKRMVDAIQNRARAMRWNSESLIDL